MSSSNKYNAPTSKRGSQPRIPVFVDEPSSSSGSGGKKSEGPGATTPAKATSPTSGREGTSTPSNKAQKTATQVAPPSPPPPSTQATTPTVSTAATSTTMAATSLTVVAAAQTEGPTGAPEPSGGDVQSAKPVTSTAPTGEGGVTSPTSNEVLVTYHVYKKMRSCGTQVPEPLTDDDFRVDPSRYKTVLCRNWIRDGECPYGPRCVYAHGDDEMRSVQDNLIALAQLAFIKALQISKTEKAGSLWDAEAAAAAAASAQSQLPGEPGPSSNITTTVNTTPARRTAQASA